MDRLTVRSRDFVVKRETLVNTVTAVRMGQQGVSERLSQGGVLAADPGSALGRG